MSDEITDTFEDTFELSESDDGHAGHDIGATKSATGDRMEFHVQMRGYTQRDMDDLIVEAAARLIVGKQTDSAMAKAIEKRCMELITQRADAVLEKVTAEILDQPLTPSFGDKKPVTMREFLGLYGREYLDQMVGRDGKPSTDSWGSGRTTRMEWLASRFMDGKFSGEVEKSLDVARMELWRAGKKQVEDFIADKKAKFAQAISSIG